MPNIYDCFGNFDGNCDICNECEVADDCEFVCLDGDMFCDVAEYLESDDEFYNEEYP